MIAIVDDGGTVVDVLVDDGDSISDMITLLWCCVASACKRLNHPFDMSLMDMADSMDQDDFAEWQKTSFEAVLAPKSDKKKA